MKLPTKLRWTTACLLALGGLAAKAASKDPSDLSPPVTASIAAAWPAPPLLVQFLESLSIERPTSFFPFLQLLATHSAKDQIFAEPKNPGELYKVVKSNLERSGLASGRGELESLGLGLAVREGTVRVEGMRKLWEAEVGETGEGCDNWIKLGGQKVCSVAAFWEFVGEEQSGKEGVLSWLGSEKAPTTYTFDHLFPPSSRSSSPLAVFYASPTSGKTFLPLFALLDSLSSSTPPRLQFALRWKPASSEPSSPLILSGFGAGLEIKKSDYLAIDDRLSKGNMATSPSDDSNNEIPKMHPVTKEDIPLLGLRAASYILSSEEPLKAFTHLTSSFPLLASQLSTLHPDPNPELNSELLSNQMSFPAASVNSFSINGLTIPVDEVEPFALLRLMRKERKLINDLQGLNGNISTRHAREWIMSGVLAKANSVLGPGKDGRIEKEALGELFDASDRKEGSGLITWWNNLEKDKRYKSWSKTLNDLLRPVYPGQMNLIARNLFNAVLVLDLTHLDALSLVADTVAQYVSRGVPLRMGLVPIVADVDAPEEEQLPTEVANAFWYLIEKVGRARTMAFLGQLHLNSVDAGKLTRPILVATWTSLAQELELSDTYEEVISGVALESFEAAEEQSEEEAKAPEVTKISMAEKARAYGRRLGLSLHNTDAGAFFLDGSFAVVNEDFNQVLQATLPLHISFLQQEIYTSVLKQNRDVNNYFYDLPTTYRTRNTYIFPSPETNPLKIVNLVDALAGAQAFWRQSAYIDGVPTLTEENDGNGPVTSQPFVLFHVITDLDTPAGRELVQNVFKILNSDSTLRVYFIHNPTPESKPSPFSLSSLLYYLIHTEPTSLVETLPIEFLHFLSANNTSLEEGIPFGIAEDNPIFSFLKEGLRGEGEMEKAKQFWAAVNPVAAKFGINSGKTSLVLNGRVIGPFEAGEFSAVDIEALIAYENEKRVLPTIEAILDTDFDLDSVELARQTPLMSTIGSILSDAYLPDALAGIFASGNTVRQADYRQLDGNLSAIIGENEEFAVFEIGVVIDPATELAQRWAPIIETLASLENVHLRLYLNPSRHLTDLPIKRFYQYSFQPDLKFDESTGQETVPSVSFEGIPEDVLLTFAMDAQRSWLAFPKTCIHDLDNIRLADLPSSSRAVGVKAVFELESLLVEGHARDMPLGQPPRGAQLELQRGSNSESPVASSRVGTIVMSNLGYFQFKANPGVWSLQIREGKSSQVFAMESIGAQGWKSDVVAKTGDTLTVTTFEGLTIYPRLRRIKGQETTELLEAASDSASPPPPKATEGLVGQIKSMFPFLAPKAPTPSALVSKPNRAEINIFTVASGLLYERMAFLMVVSVMRHTNSTVKFWFIQNFLSPSFKAFIPHMAKEYNFEYELVTYQWPHWLRAQKEKQRTIWGYKILFLDVLFPLELDRVIFVDSDQIVRTDLKELIDLDLQGAPYAYTPMGNSREETKGFRFWDSGYWKEHLKGAPYHISALYVIDLDRFRQIAAGDRLRQQYQGLSADPNSLANLDQDLPNNMQASIPIYTLDQSWLWCETWCSDESLAQAKTIDLCNNPLTHEPKLARAKRLIPEWTVYDDEVAAFAQKVALNSSSVHQSDDDAVVAFSKKADELAQAVEQSVERDEFIEAAKEEGAEKKGDSGERIKDEL